MKMKLPTGISLVTLLFERSRLGLRMPLGLPFKKYIKIGKVPQIAGIHVVFFGRSSHVLSIEKLKLIAALTRVPF